MFPVSASVVEWQTRMPNNFIKTYTLFDFPNYL